jgi:hypothetical protein
MILITYNVIKILLVNFLVKVYHGICVRLIHQNDGSTTFDGNQKCQPLVKRIKQQHETYYSLRPYYLSQIWMYVDIF